MKQLTQILRINQESYQKYIVDYPEDDLNFQNYVNTVLEVLHEHKRIVQDIQCIDMDNLIIIYKETI